nr:hypothetical protein [uncultured Rhodoferax sp.]
MNNNLPTHTEPATQDERLASRLPYETPELMVYNPSAITMGGINSGKGQDKVGVTTNYAS